MRSRWERYDETDALEEVLQDLAEEWEDEEFSEEWGDEGFFRWFGQRVRALGQRAGRWLAPRLASVWLRLREPDSSRMRRLPEPPPVVAPPPPPPPPSYPEPPLVPPGTPTNGAPPLRWDPRWFPRSSRRGNGVNFEAAEAHALMEHLGHAAAVVDSEEDAEAFVGALIPLAARLLPRAAPALLRNAPVLIRAAATATRALRGNARTRPLVRAMPAVVRRTAVSLARRTPGGRPVTPDRAARTLAAEAVGLLRRPPRCLDVLRRASRADRRYHQARREGAGLR